MNYKWNLKEIKLKLLLAKLLHNKRAISIYQNIYQIGSNNITKEILTIDDSEKVDLFEAGIYFSTALDYIPDILYEDILNLFLLFNDFDILDNNHEFNKLKMNDKDLITIGYDIIRDINNPDMLYFYEKLLKDNKINIVKNNKDVTSSHSERIGGITISNQLFRESYINIFRNDTIEDIEILIHEFMHAYYYALDNFNDSKFHLLPELEGQAGSLFAYKELEKLHFDETITLRQEAFNSIIISSLYMIINHALYITHYDPQKATYYLDETAPELGITIREDELDYYLNTQGFQTCSNTISYLIILDLINKISDNKELFEHVTNLKLNDDNSIMSILDSDSKLTFYMDNYQNIKKEYKKTRIL